MQYGIAADLLSHAACEELVGSIEENFYLLYFFKCFSLNIWGKPSACGRPYHKSCDSRSGPAPAHLLKRGEHRLNVLDSSYIMESYD